MVFTLAKITGNPISLYQGKIEGSQAEEVVIPDSVKEILSNTFFKLQNLKKVTFGKNVNVIERGIFCESSKVNEVVFPEDSLIASGLHSYLPDPKYRAVEQCITNLFAYDTLFCFSQKTDTEVYGKVIDFFESDERQVTVKISVGDRSIMVPKYIDWFQQQKFIISLQQWIGRKHYFCSWELISQFSLRLALKFAAAIELYKTEHNKFAEDFLQEDALYIAKNMILCKNEKVLIMFLKLGLTSKKNLKDILKLVQDANMTTATAYVLQKLRDEQDLHSL